MVRNDDEVKEMIIGVGNSKFAWMYGMRSGVLRAFGSRMNFLTEADAQNRYLNAGMEFEFEVALC